MKSAFLQSPKSGPMDDNYTLCDQNLKSFLGCNQILSTDSRISWGENWTDRQTENVLYFLNGSFKKL